MTEMERLIALEDIRTLKARRDHAVDSKDWDLYAELHTDDYVAAAVGDTPMIGGRAVAEHLRARNAHVSSVHHSHSPVIEFEDDDHAAGVWAMEDKLFWKQDGEAQWLRGYGFYHERYVKQDGRWLFTYRRIERIHVESSPGAAHMRIDNSGEADPVPR